MIKDQCNNCTHRAEAQCQNIQYFDGLSCDSYQKGINLEKKTDASITNADSISSTASNPSDTSANYAPEPNALLDNPNILTSEYLKETTSIHGWLSFFLFAVGLGGLISAIYPIATFKLPDYDGIATIGAIDIFTGLAFLFVAGYTIYSFNKREPNAVFVGKIYVVLVFISNLFNIIWGEFDNDGLNTAKHAVRGVTWGLIWFAYLCCSKQVKEVIPKEFRRRKTFDYYLLGAIIIVPILLFSIGLGQLYSAQKSRRAAMIQKTELHYGEYTDGIVVLTCPEGFEIEAQDVQVLHNQSITIFSLESDYANVTICSDFDSDFTKKNFKSYWSSWKDEDLKSFTESIELDDSGSANGNNYFYRVTKYVNADNELAWRYVFITDRTQEKVTIISAYDGYPNLKYGPYDYLEYFINHIRFE